ncbi:hypothetical protein RQP46_010140 [Phenoliferia psychrophenolica]
MRLEPRLRVATFLVVAATALLSQAAPTPAVAHQWILHQAAVAHYPFEVHLPDRSTRSLAPLPGPPPVLLNLSGSGARGNASQAAVLAGYDGTGRQVRLYNGGTMTGPSTLAAEEFLVVNPICPIETAQADAFWDPEVMPGILASVANQYEVDLTRVYLTTYSMGSRDAWSLLMQNPEIFAGAVISSGSTAASSTQLKALLGIPIRNYYGSEDETGLAERSITTQSNYDVALKTAPASVNTSNVLETIIVPGANHLAMTYRPWDANTTVDGYPGALSWLLQQQRTSDGSSSLI